MNWKSEDGSSTKDGLSSCIRREGTMLNVYGRTTSHSSIMRAPKKNRMQCIGFFFVELTPYLASNALN